MSFTVTALKEVEVTLSLELLHGIYYPDFDNLMNNIGELLIFTPSRSDYTPLSPSRKSFLFVLDKEDFDDLQVSGDEHAVGSISEKSLVKGLYLG